MGKIKNFFVTSLLGGIVVILPAAVTYFVFCWLFNIVASMIQPLTNLVVRASALKEVLASAVVICIILVICFLVGILIKTKLGAWIYRTLENRILKVFPGYTLIKETIAQLIGTKKSPFSSVAVVTPFGNETKAIGFITAVHPDGMYTVFLPTAPNPTSGYVLFLKKENVYPVDLPTESVMKTIIACGVGSQMVFETYLKTQSQGEIGPKPY
jgi:uncharacterized membrane protein